MSVSFAILTKEIISKKQLSQFILSLQSGDNGNEYYPGQIINGNRVVWISVSKGDLEVHLLNLSDPEFAKSKAVLLQKLGDMPQTCVHVYGNRQEASRDIAIDFALEFAKHWDCIIWDDEYADENGLYSIDEIEKISE
jgi:hypothetical protein